jgi:SAM-dependent methyltransferase
VHVLDPEHVQPGHPLVRRRRCTREEGGRECCDLPEAQGVRDAGSVTERRPWWHWDHNAQFHRYLLDRLPSSFERGLDVGCGTGAFARTLARRAVHLDAIDVQPAVVDAARLAVPQPANVRWLTGDVLTEELPVEAYDVVTAVASLHHLPLEQGVRRLADLVRPGGHLAVVGLARASSLRDLLPALATLPLDPVIGTWQALRRRDRPDGDEPPVPLRDPTTTVAQVTAAARRLLPGAVVRRHLFYRYTLIWPKPTTPRRR